MPLPPPTSNAAPEQRAVPATPASRLRWVARGVLGVVVTAWSLLLVAWLALYWAILPHIEQWRPQIEARASAALGVPLRIGAIELRSSGWVPALELRDVLLLDAHQRPALRLPRVAAAISARSLFGREFRFEQLLIDGAEVDARRDAQGRIFVAGLELGRAGAGSDDSAALDWFFKQREFVIRGGTLRWTDELRGAPPLALTGVDLVVRNGLRQHDVRLDATPDAAWGDRFTLRGRFTQPLLARSGEWQRWSGDAYASLPRADLRLLRRHVDLPFELDEGDGALRGWFELKDGEPRTATVDVALRAVTLQLQRDVQALEFEQIEGRLVGERNRDGMVLAAQRFGFLTGDGIRWPAGDMRLALRQAGGAASAPVQGGEFSAQRLDLGLIAQVATRIPLGEAVRKLLVQVNPRGIASGLQLQWDGPLDAPAHYRAQGLLSGLSLDAKASDEPDSIGRPGLRNATLKLDATEAGGHAQLGLDGGALDLPGVFAEALLPLDTFSADLAWKIEAAAAPRRAPPDKTRAMPADAPAPSPPRISVQLRQARLANADVQGEVSGNWSSGAGSGVARGGRFPGQLELDAKIVKARAERTARYLPLGIPEDTRLYLQQAIGGGTLSRGSIHIRGDLWDFPYYRARSNREGEFRFAAHVEDVSFAYVPSLPARAAEPASTSPWPALTQLSGDVLIDRAQLDIRNAKARLGGAQWDHIHGGIRNMVEGSTLLVDATGRGPLAEMVRYVNTTPVGGWIGKALASTSASGPADLQLTLNIPLADVGRSKLTGHVDLNGNEVRLRPDVPLLAAARGRVDFNEKGVQLSRVAVKSMGGDAQLSGGSQPDGSLRFAAQGTASADGLRRTPELGALLPLARSLSGQANYQLTLGFVNGLPEIGVMSNLAGLGIDLPAPLNKPAATPWPLRVQTTLAADAFAPGLAPRDTLRLELGAVLQAQFVRDLAGEAPRVLRGGIGVMQPAPRPAAGVSANVDVPVLDVSAWETALARLLPSGGPSTGSSAGSAAQNGYAPDLIALRTQRLVRGTRELNALVAGIAHDAGTWRANVASQQLNGYVEYRPSGPSSSDGRVYARLARLSLPKSDADQVESLLDEQPATVPALDIVVDDFELRGKHLGRVEVEALNREAAKEWSLTRFRMSTPEAELSATGSWAAMPGQPPGAPRRRTSLNFKLAVGDSGALLERLGSGRAIRGGKGQLAGDVSWLGSPLSLDYPSLAGQVNVNIAAGQFLKADAGAARLLGVLSLQSLPRRLVLDFRDVFQQGFAFDAISGDVHIEQGVAQTSNLRMRGLQAIVAMAGSADIEQETQDLRIAVVPEINAGAASLAYAAINPAVGLGTFLAQLFLRKPLTAAGTREFHVTGSWDEPKVERIERKTFDAVPGLDEPAADATPVPNPAARPKQ